MAFKNVITSRNPAKSSFTVDEEIIIGALRSFSLQLEDIEVLFKMIEEQPDRNSFLNV
jgi:hypothetical protein